jgi:hypothetical protein
LVEGFDTAAAIAYQLSEILRINVPVWVAVDSRTLFTVLMRMGRVWEKRLMIDVAELRDQYVQDICTGQTESLLDSCERQLC